MKNVVDESTGAKSFASRCVTEFFPFREEFEQVVDGVVTLNYLSELKKVLEPAVDVATDHSDIRLNPERTVALVSAAAALARIAVVEAYAEELTQLHLYGREPVLDALCMEWRAMVERDQMVFVVPCSVVVSYLGELVAEVWHKVALTTMASADDLIARFGTLLNALPVAQVGGVLVVSAAGIVVGDSSAERRALPLLPQAAYRELMGVLAQYGTSSVDGHNDPYSVFSGYCGSLCDVVVDEGILSSWVWLLRSGLKPPTGYCYQMVFPPSTRLLACRVLGANPKVAELLWYIGASDTVWAGHFARIIERDGALHVTHAGDPDVTWLSDHAQKVIGVGTPQTPQVDYFARALVDDFIGRHAVVPAKSYVEPVDKAFDSLTLSSTQVGNRTFSDVAHIHYAGVGEALSPRTAGATTTVAGHVARGDYISERDGQRVVALYHRLADGPVVDERYYRRSWRRFSRSRTRPALDDSGGRVYHLFSGFPADGGSGLGPWELDDCWDVPGWTSYVAKFPPGAQHTLSFTSPFSASDIRMDCSGDAAMDFGDCKVATLDVVLWFTDSIKFRLTTRTKLYLRISIPDTGSAPAIGSDMRRYMYIPGYAVVARSFDIVKGIADYHLPLSAAELGSCAGCSVFTGKKFIERGRHRIKFTQLPSTAPVKMVLKTEPVECLEYVSVCGMRVKPRSRDYVCVMYDVRNADFYVSLNEDARVIASAMQVINRVEFDLTVESVRDAREDC